MRSSLLSEIPWVLHGFGDRQLPIEATLLEIFQKTRAQWKQVHGTTLVEIQEPNQAAGEADAFFTQKENLPIGVVTADCVPILMASRTQKAVCAIHAGWRGTFDAIVPKVWQSLSSQGHAPKDWVAAIGPSIRSCCYEVSESLAHDFSEEFSRFDRAKFLPRERFLDLAQIHFESLKEIGLGALEILPDCTQCTRNSTNPKYYSYRRDHDSQRQYSLISIQTSLEN